MSRLYLPDDGIVDDVAIERRRAGERVPLSRRELVEAAHRIADAGGTAHDVARSLHVSGRHAHKLLAARRPPGRSIA